MSVTIGYKGNTIATMDASGSKTLKTQGKYCEADITVDYVNDGGITPSGSKIITTNGTHDVTNYATADVNVSSGPSNIKVFEVTVASDQSTKTILTSADTDIAAHLSEDGFFVGIIPLFAYSSAAAFRGGFNTNHNLIENTASPVYGSLFRVNASGSNNALYITKKANAFGGDIGVSASGEIFMYATSTVPLRAGKYMAYAGWEE